LGLPNGLESQMSFDAPNRMLDVIYEAAALPDMWPAVLDDLAEMVGGVGTILLTTDPRNLRWTCSDSVRQLFLDFLEGRWHERNPRMERLVLNRHSGFVREIDMFGVDEMDSSPTFQEFLRPRGFGWAVGTVVQVPSEDMLAFSIERRFADGPVEDQHIPTLNALRPHLARAALMSARLRLGRAQGMAESLNRMGLPSAVLLGDGKVIATSPLFEKLGGQVISRAFGQIALADAGANALLSEAIQNLNSSEYQFGAKSIPVPSKGESAAVIVHLIPVRRSAHDIFGPAMSILVVTPLGSSQSLPDELLNGLFDLSPAEIRAANGLLQGKTINELAASMGLSRETIRTQVKAVLAKTGSARQSDLVSLLANVSIPRWHGPQ
jgi:DNA-binding CsgD family transcriptional regulator